MGVQTGIVQKTLTQSRQWSDPIELKDKANLGIRGTWQGTITIQRSFDGGDTWESLPTTFTSNTQRLLNLGKHAGVLYKIGFANGGWTSGTAYVTLTV